MRPKATGAWNLHELTKALPEVEQFVLFSSIVSWVGHQGALPPRPQLRSECFRDTWMCREALELSFNIASPHFSVILNCTHIVLV